MVSTGSSVNYREFLISRGYDVATLDFPGQDGRRWVYVRSVPVDGIWNRLTRVGRQWFVQLQSGDWRNWDDAKQRPWSQGPWHECLEPIEGTQAPGIPSTSEPLPDSLFVQSLRQLGFTPVSPPSWLGNVWVERNGIQSLAVASSRSLVRMHQGQLEQTPLVRECSPEAAKPVTTPPVALFVSMQTCPVQISGRNHQAALFS